jgi:hypothetical protein
MKHEHLKMERSKLQILVMLLLVEPHLSQDGVGKCVKPLVGTNSCQAPHTSYIISGRMKVRMDDGSEIEGGPGDTAVIPPGHNAWVVGNEPCIMIDFTGAKDYAKGGAS